MTTGSWDPQAASVVSLEAGKLAGFAALATDSALTSINECLDEDDRQWLALVMSSSDLNWQEAVATLDVDELLRLILFFTAVEMQVPGCKAGVNSPVIPLNKIRKKKGQRLDKNQLAWIKQHSDNRFIPNGPLL